MKKENLLPFSDAYAHAIRYAERNLDQTLDYLETTFPEKEISVPVVSSPRTRSAVSEAQFIFQGARAFRVISWSSATMRARSSDTTSG